MRPLIRFVTRPLSLSMFALGAAVMHAACGGGGGSNTTKTPNGASSSSASDVDASTTAQQQAAGAEVGEPGEDWESEHDVGACHAPLADCDQHAVDAVDAMDQLIEVEQTVDKRSVPIAIDALGSRDAEVVVEALRIIGRFPKEEGVYAAVKPKLVDARPRVQILAARVLKGTSEGSDLGKQYEKGHAMSLEGVAPDEHTPQRSPSTWGFAPLANAVPYPPGDSLSSIAYSTTAPVDQVASFYAQQPNAKRMTATEYGDIRRKLVDQLTSGPEIKEMQQLQQQMMQGGRPNQQAADRMKELTQKFETLGKAAADVTPYPPDSILREAQFVVIGAASPPERWVAVYREPAYDRTVAILSWAPQLGLPPVPTLTPHVRTR